jgi:hypothetical protein
MITKQITSPDFKMTVEVEVVKETPKAICLRGKCSTAWYPKAALKDGVVQDWFQQSLSHFFLFDAPLSHIS